MLKPINGWTKKGMIDHLKKEFKGFSFDRRNMECRYRSTNGRKCALGVFIPDELYNYELEGLGAVSLQEMLQKQSEETADNQLNLIQSKLPLTFEEFYDLQGIHDQFITDPEIPSKDYILEKLISWIELNVTEVP